MRDPEDLMPAMDGMDPETKEPSPDGSGMSGGPDTAAARGRTDVDAFGSDPDVRFPGATEDPTMTTSDAVAEEVVRGEGLGEDTGALAFDEQEGTA